MNAVQSKEKSAILQPRNLPSEGVPGDLPASVATVVEADEDLGLTLASLASLADSYSVANAWRVVLDAYPGPGRRDTLESPAVKYRAISPGNGFVRAVNSVAQESDGEYLLIVGRGLTVSPNAADLLLETCRYVPDAGLVCAQVIGRNGRLAQAGVIVWNDGTRTDYGALDDPGLPKYNYMRETDGGTGCIFVKREMLLRVGLFDAEYCDFSMAAVDMAMKIRDERRRVLYQPAVRAALAGEAGPASGVPSAEARPSDAERFRTKWRKALPGYGVPGRPREVEKERRTLRRILVLDECVCLPDQDSGSLRMYSVLRVLQVLGYKVTFFPDNLSYPPAYTERMRARGVEILTVEHTGSLEAHLWVHGHSYDAVLLSRSRVAGKHIDKVLRHSRGKTVVFDTVDLHFLREAREAEVKNDPELRRAAVEQKERELGLAAKADVTLVVSEMEKEILLAENPRLKVEVVSNVHEVYGSAAPFRERSGILFIGGFLFSPNVDAMLFFVRDVWPLVKEKLARRKENNTDGLLFYIIGSNPPDEIRSLACEDVVVTGHVPDVSPFFNRCRLSVAPLRWGAGIKGKINQSMSYGVPVAATPLAVEGMRLEPGESVLVGEGAAELAEEVARGYTDEALWDKLSKNGLDNVRRHFSFDVALQSMEKALLPFLKKASRTPNPSKVSPRARLISFYLPQFHPTPENDAWWGEGFTEWRNVSAAAPQYPGHRQPNVPTDLGYYDLRVPENLRRQADLARDAGIEGFCFWHYWFNGKLLLQGPIQRMLASNDPDFPFCLAWANESWSREWHGRPYQILQDQTYGGEDDDRRHFHWLLPALADPRAIRLDGKPLLLVYKAKDLPDPHKTTSLWRSLAKKHGLQGLFLLSIETTGTFGWDPREGGFDAAVHFQPDWNRVVDLYNNCKADGSLRPEVSEEGLWVLDYRQYWSCAGKETRPYPSYPGIFPRWDNTPRRKERGLVFENATPGEYERWLTGLVQQQQASPAEHRLIFVNAWNEWAEGNYLEPDMRFDRGFLEATGRAVTKPGISPLSQG